ncbi:hypothetical protein SDRG_13555 [Saprolegnia diclina VS20]|uniref:PI3K-RBD domain-containing protein n=1 Tax=Saprolegnia diclina (strain VS20) TaxID=1156394 RepID=T0Q5H2_SAPDV|nr:hypothetical protein SDRG_13555 [Saprolegnia diclina VS20]EQC28680.1 hypothetical protein SDRG_13555 [Saprolegnia diclina VS20]|eukprot:XP_008617872.1 hypothetical protein SDRG_13555 [Saprolegnia diclina VS20]
MLCLVTEALLPTSLVSAPMTMQGRLSVRFQPRSSQATHRYFVLDQDALSYDECDHHDRPLGRVDIPVASITAVRLGFNSSETEVITTHHGTLQLRSASSTDWGDWARALCSVVPLRCVDAALRDRFRVCNRLNVLLLADDTVGNAVDAILHAFHCCPDAPPRSEYNASNYVLAMTDTDVCLADRQRMLCTYEHVRYCLASSQPFRVTLTLATDDVLVRDEAFVDPYAYSMYEM